MVLWIWNVSPVLLAIISPLLWPLALSKDSLKTKPYDSPALSCLANSNHFLDTRITLNNQGGLIWVDFANDNWFFASVTWINPIWCFQPHLQDCGLVAIQHGDRESSKPERGDKHLKQILSPSLFPKLHCSRGSCFLRAGIWKWPPDDTEAYFKTNKQLPWRFRVQEIKGSLWLGRIWRANKAPIHLGHSSNQLCLNTAYYFRVNRVKPTYWSQTVHRKWKKILNSL